MGYSAPEILAAFTRTIPGAAVTPKSHSALTFLPN